MEHFEPLVLIGTDILIDTQSDIKFCYVGLHPETRLGQIVFKDKQDHLIEVELASWPMSGNVSRTPHIKDQSKPKSGLKELLQRSKMNKKPT